MSASPIRLLLVDDHSIVRMGFAALLGAESDFQIVAEAEDAEQAVSAFREHRPDVTLMDVRLSGGNGIEAMARILAEFPAARIVILTTYDLEEPLFAALDGGAAGYLLKSIKRDELVAAIRCVHAGGTCFPAALAQRLSERQHHEPLSPRETETLDLVRRGLSNRDIGTALGVSENTAKAHVRAILRKLDVAGRGEAIAAGFERGLLEID